MPDPRNPDDWISRAVERGMPPRILVTQGKRKFFVDVTSWQQNIAAEVRKVARRRERTFIKGASKVNPP